MEALHDEHLMLVAEEFARAMVADKAGDHGESSTGMTDRQNPPPTGPGAPDPYRDW